MDKPDEYRVVPRDLSVPVPQSIRANEAEIFGMYLCMATQGISLSKACETTVFTSRSVANWVNNYPEWMVGIQDRALTEAARYKLILAHRLVGARIDIELQVERLVLDSVLGVVKATIQEALAGNLHATRLVRTWAAEGFGLIGEGERGIEVRSEPEISKLAYDPTQPLTRADVRSPPGTTVTLKVETPDFPLDIVATKVPSGTDS